MSGEGMLSDGLRALRDERAVCFDCGQVVSVCDHVAARLVDPMLSFQLGRVAELQAKVERLEAELAEARERGEAARQELSFTRGMLEDIGSSLMPVRDGDSLRRLARSALVTLDDYWPAEPAPRPRPAGLEALRCGAHGMKACGACATVERACGEPLP